MTTNGRSYSLIMNNKILIYLKNIISSLMIGVISFTISSCSEDKFDIDPSNKDQYKPWEDKNMAIIPLGVSFEAVSNLTKASGDPIDGDKREHLVDFETENSCFAVFFDDNKKVQYISNLYLSEQLTDNYIPEEGNKVGEYTLFTLAYVPKEYVEENARKLYYVLVVLNGKDIYSLFQQEFERYKGDTGYPHMDIFRKLIWSIDQNHMQETIGSYRKGSDYYFTMTNSAYYERNGNLITEVELRDKFYLSVNEYIKDEDRQTAADICVERMVAKFTQPSFSTEVIGSDRVFRPDQNALPLVVYSWDENNRLTSDQKNWRIHLLGWTINGEETENYIFKQIPPINDFTESWRYWNDPVNFRSHWSIDPHYDSKKKGNGFDFYPWQFRRAADRTDIISVQAAQSSNAVDYSPALRYYSFDEVTWPATRYVHENTFNPFGDWYEARENQDTNIPTNENYLDGRPPLLAGSHLLITAELYLEKKGGSYMGQFDRVDEIYSDRIRRYFTCEKDWFKMFLRDFNRTLATQEVMSFPVYKWHASTDGKDISQKFVNVTGDCKLYFGDKPLTYNLIDELEKEGYSFSAVANVRNGDGRLIPWVTKGDDYDNDPTEPKLNLRDGEGNPLSYRNREDSAGSYPHSDWDNDMYMSFFYDWFGPIDHYKEGKMYYAGEIKHHINESNSEGTKYDFFGIVRNHWYKFNITSISSMGVPVDDPTQPIIPGKYNYRDQILVYLDIIDWHQIQSELEFD